MVSSRQTLRNRLKLRQLNLLVALDETGSLHKAADRLGMSQPAATRHLQDLEGLMGASLFERTRKGMQATPMGQLLIRHAAMELAGIDHVHEEAQALQSGNTGCLRIGLHAGAPSALVAQAITSLKQATPHLGIQLVEGDHDQLLSELQEGRMGMVIGRAPPVNAPGLAFEALFTDHFCIVCGAQNTSLPREPEGLADLLPFSWVLPFAGTAFRKSLDLQFLGQCGRLPSDLIETVSVTTVQALLTRGDHVAVMPHAVARPLLQAGHARVLIHRLAGITGPVGITTRSGEARNSALARLVQALHDASRDLMAQTDHKSGSPQSKHASRLQTKSL
jgi:DNA-binding transcriptional LysR family regulator